MIVRRIFSSKKSIDELKELAPQREIREAHVGQLVLKIIEVRGLPENSRLRILKEDEAFKLFKTLSKYEPMERLKQIVGEERFNSYFARTFATQED